MNIRVLVVSAGLVLLGGGAAPEANADPKGRLIFLGWTRDLQHSVWLSAVQPGVFDLVDSQYSQTIDFWTQERAGLRLSVSSHREEYGGTHNLFTQITDQYSQYENFVDSADQCPCRPLLPNTWPPITLPPPPTEPGFPDGGVTGLMPTLPPGVNPPIATLPPTGVMPQLPPVERPPTGVMPGLPPVERPPTGVMPGLPPVERPPTGVMPGLPPVERPPTGVMPQLPGGVTPPVGTLPPTGVMPQLPGGVTPPVGTLPPTGVMPQLPGGVTPPVGTLPPTGVMPQLPGGVTPPVGTLPPTGVMPQLPGGVTPPVGTLPPTGVMPQLPGGVTPPVGTLPPTGVMPQLPGGAVPPVGTLPPEVRPPVGPLPPGVQPAPGMPGTGERVGAIVAEEAARRPASHGWNLWLDNTYYDISDDRDGASGDGSTNALTIGVDKVVRRGMILGWMFSWQDSDTSRYADQSRIDSEGYTTGPYFAWQIGERWMFDASAYFGANDTSQRILVLSGGYDSKSYGAAAGLTGSYSWGATAVRPRLAINWSRNSNDAMSLRGTLGAIDLDIVLPESTTNFSAATLSTEFARYLGFMQSVPTMAYLDLEAQYGLDDYAGVNSLTGELTSAKESSWTGRVKLGVRMLVAQKTTLTLAGGYSSIGQDDLDISEWRLYLSHSF